MPAWTTSSARQGLGDEDPGSLLVWSQGLDVVLAVRCCSAAWCRGRGRGRTASQGLLSTPARSARWRGRGRGRRCSGQRARRCRARPWLSEDVDASRLDAGLGEAVGDVAGSGLGAARAKLDAVTMARTGTRRGEVAATVAGARRGEGGTEGAADGDVRASA